jgi:hypothetical protein
MISGATLWTLRAKNSLRKRRDIAPVPIGNLRFAQTFSGFMGGTNMSLGTILLIILVIALLGGFSGVGGGPFYGTGYYGGGGLGLLLVIVLILVLLGRL